MKRRRLLALLLALVSAPLAVHFGIAFSARRTPPKVQPPKFVIERPRANLLRFGPSWVLDRGAILEVGLRGSPEQIGYSHSRLLYPYMIENEGILLSRFEGQVPSSVFRHLLLDLAQLRYRNVDLAMSDSRRREIASGALGFQPDPYTRVFPTYQRFLYLNALYDIALSFEESPLIGCTTFAFSNDSVDGGGAMLARAFDFEVDAIFDRRKAVFLVHEDGKIPFASVAWPGLVGVVSGMNAEGLALVVHGARAGEPRAEGEPVVHATRRVLSEARTVAEAKQLLDQQSPLVSHIIVVADAFGDSMVLERVPGALSQGRKLPEKAAVTNHFEGTFANDPKNLRVLERTSSKARRERGDELVAALSEPITVTRAIALLRDRASRGGTPLPLGDRRAIDALIATHAVVMQTKKRTLWVSEAPHLLGRFVAFDLGRMLSDDYRPDVAIELPTQAADPLLVSDAYRAHLKALSPNSDKSGAAPR